MAISPLGTGVLIVLFAVCHALDIPLQCATDGNCTAVINAAIKGCGASACDITFEAGTYPLNGAPYGPRLVFRGLRSLSFRGTGATSTIFLIDDIAQPFRVENGVNITFSQFGIDMVRVPFTYAQVATVTGISSVLEFKLADYPVNMTRFPWQGRAQGILSIDPVKRRVAVDGTDIYALDNPINLTYNLASNPPMITVEGVKLKQFDYVVLRHQTYSFDAFQVTDSASVTWTAVSIYATGGMGILTESSTDIVMDGLRIERLGSRPMSITADGIHISNPRRGSVILRNSLFDGQGDDGVNVPTIYQEILSMPDAYTLRVGRAGVVSTSPVVRAGSTISFWNRSSLMPLWTGAVNAVGADGTIHLAQPPGPAGLVKLFDLITNTDYVADYVEVRNCTFRSNRARGVLLKSSNVLAVNNTFDGCSGPAVKTETDGCYWFEGHPVANWTFSNNTIIDVNFGPGKEAADIFVDNSVPVFVNGTPSTQCEESPDARVNSDIRISGNSLLQGHGQGSISVYSSTRVSVQGNVAVRMEGAPVPAFDLVCSTCVDASQSGNVCAGGACTQSGFT